MTTKSSQNYDLNTIIGLDSSINLHISQYERNSNSLSKTFKPEYTLNYKPNETNSSEPNVVTEK